VSDVPFANLQKSYQSDYIQLTALKTSNRDSLLGTRARRSLL